MSLDNEFQGKKVYVEAHLYGGAGKSAMQTTLYEGEYSHLERLGGKGMLVLKNAEYFTPSDVTWMIKGDVHGRSTSKVKSNLIVISVRDIVSICLADKGHE